MLGFGRILKQITHMGISVMLKLCWATRMHCIYQNIDNIYSMEKKYFLRE